MKNLVIIGAGGFGREVYNWALQDAYSQFNIKGFIDDNTDALLNFHYPVKVIAKISDYIPEQDDFFICAIGNPVAKKKVVEMLLAKGAVFTSVIHRSALIGENVILGVGNIVCPGVVLTCDIRIGNHNAFNVQTVVGHDCKIGNYNQLSCFCDINGYATLTDAVFLGGRSSVFSKVILNPFVKVGAGAVVMKSVEEGLTVVGIPAKKI